MCELTLASLGSSVLNRKGFLIAGILGSVSNDDGWGYGDVVGVYKTAYPMHMDLQAGEMLREVKSKSYLLGHVRAASTNVPVCKANSHPFLKQNIIFMHNGKLTPLDEKKFTLEYTVEETNEKGVKVTRTYKHSDSKIFFEHFLSKYKKDANFLEKLQETMDDFYGKFAMMFYIGTDVYVARGKTANLYISYLLDDNKNPTGYFINTSAATLNLTTSLMSNLETLEGRPPLNFSNPALLPDETVWKAGPTDLEVLGKMKENSSPSYTGSYTQRDGTGNFSQTGGWTSQTGGGGNTGAAISKEDFLIRELYDFVRRYSISYRDVSDMFMRGYGISLLDLEPAILEHFFKKVVPLITKKAPKDVRKEVMKTLQGLAVNRTEYIGLGKQFPWMLWTHEQKKAFIDSRKKAS